MFCWPRKPDLVDDKEDDGSLVVAAFGQWPKELIRVNFQLSVPAQTQPDEAGKSLELKLEPIRR